LNITNFTSFPAEVTISTDKHGADWYLVVVKGTFSFPDGGDALPAEAQIPFFYGDKHYGEPESTSIMYESEFAPVKALADVVLIGTAHAPGGAPARSVVVELKVAEMSKRIRVVGDRVWRSVLGLFAFPSAPKPFIKMPIRYERAFGGCDTSHKNPKKHGFDRRNLVGAGFQRGRSAAKAKGKPLPNLEHPGDRLRRPGQRIRPAAYGPLSRSWESRAKYAGTYDARWKEECFPLLPEDFDERYFQGVPPDQMRPHFRGGETIRLVNLTPEGVLTFRLPDLTLPVILLFEDHREALNLLVDTLILEPDDRRFQVLWRIRRPVHGKLLSLAEVLIGEPSPGRKRSLETGKRYLDWSVA
jgi:hypothetical protein